MPAASSTTRGSVVDASGAGAGDDAGAGLGGRWQKQGLLGGRGEEKRPWIIIYTIKPCT